MKSADCVLSAGLNPHHYEPPGFIFSVRIMEPGALISIEIRNGSQEPSPFSRRIQAMVSLVSFWNEPIYFTARRTIVVVSDRPRKKYVTTDHLR